jgi:hypothetical protein
MYARNPWIFYLSAVPPVLIDTVVASSDLARCPATRGHLRMLSLSAETVHSCLVQLRPAVHPASPPHLKPA